MVSIYDKDFTFSRPDIDLLNKMVQSCSKQAGYYNRPLDIYEFQDGVINGIITDDAGIAQLMINNIIRPEYHINIDRKNVSRRGQIISFIGLLKMYDPKVIKVVYRPRSLLW